MKDGVNYGVHYDAWLEMEEERRQQLLEEEDDEGEEE